MADVGTKGGPVTDAEMVTNQASDGAKQQRKSSKVGRNDPCPCGSGKKYKNCHGAVRNRRAASVA